MKAELPAHVLAGELQFASAWDRVRSRRGMCGVDGISVGRFERGAERGLRSRGKISWTPDPKHFMLSVWLRSPNDQLISARHLTMLQSALGGGSYHQDPLRLAVLEKKNGGHRFLLVPTVADRIAQAAVALWLGARWDRDFDAASFAYRPGLGSTDALLAVGELRDQGYRWVLDADIRSFFDGISHRLLVGELEARLGANCPILGWVRRWLAAPVWDGQQLRPLSRGVPQGSPISPLLANVYLDPFDRRLRKAGAHLVRYADDFLVLARTPFELAQYREIVETTLGQLGLELNDQKTRVTTFEKCFRFLGAEIRSDAILVPLKKHKTPRAPTFVAPPMPPALLRAYRGGAWQAAGEFTGLPEAPPSAVRCPTHTGRRLALQGAPFAVALACIRRFPS